LKPVAMKLARALLCSCLVWASGYAAEHPPGEHPLLDLARALETTRKSQPDGRYYAPEVRSFEHALEQADPPADADCARSMGASVYADLYVDLGQALEAGGDYRGAVRAYRRALACVPRSARILANLAAAQFSARDVAGARAAVHEGLAIDSGGVYLNRVAGAIDFIEQRWANAVSRFRYVAASEKDRERAAFAQLMYWLAQLRAGVPKPEFVARRHTEDWPRPLMLYMQGQYTEIELLGAVRDVEGDYGEVLTDQRLCQALYYVGEAYWARGNPDVALDYFTAVVNTRVVHLDEHSMALAEIAVLRKPAAQ
jgi:tetratricopeptide (TPR) repeat protein